MNRLILPAEMGSLKRFLMFVDACTGEAGLDKGTGQRVTLAAEEVIVNIIRYAYPGGAGEIEVQCGKEKEGIVLIFKDWGIPFNPLKAPAPDTHLPLEQRKIGGMGILLVRKMIPTLRYERIDGANRLTFMIPFTKQEAMAS